ncbi:flagellar export chaperone FliS [uncultured Jatrophihabitans sp.]|uniref:flagellar export chaperone FliS n=1 Tax=uncultured Jatrophihabitans sp. TaxID=1610747 RepID=UPI0035CAACA8
MDARSRYLTDRVMTATPAQRVVMLYDRLALDIERSRECTDALTAGPYLGHAALIVAELLSSLDHAAGGPAEDLAAIYGFLLTELTAIRAGGELGRLVPVVGIVGDLRDAFAHAAAATAGMASTAAASAVTAATRTLSTGVPVTSTAWVG